MASCVFCRIVRGEIPASRVYEDDHVIAFEDTNPAAPTHVLVVPKRHIATLDDAADEDEHLLGKLVLCARRVAAERKLSNPGYRLVMNVQAGAGQSVFHVHLHVLGGRGFRWPPG